MAPLRALLVRLGWTVLSLLLFLTVLHSAFYLLPGDPVRALFGLRSPGIEVIAEIRSTLGLDDPYPQQLWRYLTGLISGDLGPVYRLAPGGLRATGTSVGQLVGAALPFTLRLIGTALVMQLVVGTVLAVVTAEARGRRLLLLKVLLSGMVGVPAFIAAALLVTVAPSIAAGASMLAAAACLAALPAAMVAVVGYPAVREARVSSYVQRAIASGMPTGRVRWMHALRPTLGPMAVVSAAQVGGMMTGAILVEAVLSRPGIGAVLVQAINARQGPTLLAVVGVSFVLVAALNLLADVVVMVLDPRLDAI